MSQRYSTGKKGLLEYKHIKSTLLPRGGGLCFPWDFWLIKSSKNNHPKKCSGLSSKPALEHHQMGKTYRHKGYEWVSNTICNKLLTSGFCFILSHLVSLSLVRHDSPVFTHKVHAIEEKCWWNVMYCHPSGLCSSPAPFTLFPDWHLIV